MTLVCSVWRAEMESWDTHRCYSEVEVLLKRMKNFFISDTLNHKFWTSYRA